jgi:hypothetical protein
LVYIARTKAAEVYRQGDTSTVEFEDNVARFQANGEPIKDGSSDLLEIARHSLLDDSFQGRRRD